MTSELADSILGQATYTLNVEFPPCFQDVIIKESPEFENIDYTIGDTGFSTFAPVYSQLFEDSGCATTYGMNLSQESSFGLGIVLDGIVQELTPEWLEQFVLDPDTGSLTIDI